MKSSEEWIDGQEQIKALADCLSQYKIYLDLKSADQSKNQKLEHPVRQVSDSCTVEHRPRAVSIKEQYRVFDACVTSRKNEEIFLCEDTHLLTPFLNNMQRHWFFDDIRLSVPVDCRCQLICIAIALGGPMSL